jgi:trehalose 6-phosphate synthase
MTDFEQYLRDRTLIVVSNREPYEHVAPAEPGGESAIRRPAGGLVSALDPTLQRTRGTWVAWGSGSGDRDAADAQGRVQVPPEDPRYTLRRVWLSDEDVEGYYQGFANTALWPICHLLIQHYHFRDEYWHRYRAVNAAFAEAAADEAARAEHAPVVWVQDYHLALAPGMLRARLAERHPDVARRTFVHQFWHIPFPGPDLLNLLPTETQGELVRGLLGNDLVGFHTERHAMNFMDCAAAFVPEAEVRREHHRVRFGGRDVHVGAFPISIDVAAYERMADAAAGHAAELRARYATGTACLGVSVDRVDYTKGIPERLRALDELWRDVPALRGCLTVIAVATPSRTDVASYAALDDEVLRLVDEINARWGTPEWTPLVLRHENVPAEELAGIYRAGDLCLVTSLQDGMNLVAKEFLACQADERGVLVLSRLTGAAEELDGAVEINPFNVDSFVEGIRQAVEMPGEERRARVRAMRERLRGATIFDWLAGILRRVDELAPAPAGPGAPAA